MKRSVLLIVLLFLVALTWGGLRLKDRQWHQWLATARRDELEKYVADHRDQTEALVHLAILLRNAGERERAETLVRHAVEVAPNEETNWVEFSRTLTDDQEAIRGLEGFLKVMPDSAPVMAELGRHYLQIGDAATARTLLVHNPCDDRRAGRRGARKSDARCRERRPCRFPLRWAATRLGHTTRRRAHAWEPEPHPAEGHGLHLRLDDQGRQCCIGPGRLRGAEKRLW